MSVLLPIPIRQSKVAQAKVKEFYFAKTKEEDFIVL